MASQRFKLKENKNHSKNTRMDIAEAGLLANWRPDELAHISRYCKIAEHIMDEAARLKRPIDCFEVGVGQCWPLRYLSKAIICRKAEQVREYVGYDIDPAVLRDLWQPDKDINDTAMLKSFNGRVVIQDMTLKPTFQKSKVKDGKFDMFFTTEVIEHMGRKFVEPWIKNASSMLRKGGLAYVSTPNHDGSNAALPKDHVYEWGFLELHDMLSKHFEVIRVDGIFTQINNFKAARKDATSKKPSKVVLSHGINPSDELMALIKGRFDPHWQRVILGMFYPHLANNCAWLLRKR